MSLRSKQPENSFENPPTGTHPARCYGIIDIGLQKSTYMGVEKLKEKVVLQFELTNALMKDGRPFIINAFRTNSLAPKAELRKNLEGWRGRGFTEEELNGFDLPNILGKACLLSIVEEVKSDKTYTNIDSISAPIQGMEVPPLTNPTVVYDIDKHDQAVFERLPKWLQERIVNRETPPDEQTSPPPVRQPTARDAPTEHPEQLEINEAAAPAPEFDDRIPF